MLIINRVKSAIKHLISFIYFAASRLFDNHLMRCLDNVNRSRGTFLFTSIHVIV